MSNPAFKPSEGKREEFRKYLEKNGVMDALTKVLVNLYEEVDKPEDALEYIRDKLAAQAGIETHNQLKVRIEELETQVAELEQQIEELKGDKPPEEEGVPEEIPADLDGDAPLAPPTEETGDFEEPPPPPPEPQPEDENN